MTLFAVSAASLPIATVVGGMAMVLAGVKTKKLRGRIVRCPVCGSPRAACTCRWL